MNYCMAASDRFERIADPYKQGRICFRNRHEFFERYDLQRILEDENLLFIHDNIVYFKN